jgi:competence protein ComEA
MKNIRVFDWLHTAQKNSVSIQININKASVEELLRVSGIGPKTAEFIVSYRHSNGLFTNLEVLHQARGMSPSRYERIIKHLKI